MTSRFAACLIDWHRAHGRHHLPWQHSADPYRIWLSEIMLQQTQVEVVVPYYVRFVECFPDLPALAAAPLDAVLAQWSGLGYYARARNLHKAARTLITEHDGRFPRRLQDIVALPGIGRSTAAAIAVFAFGERAPILDGNVKRVLCRAFGIGGFPGDRAVETQLWALAEQLLPAADAPTYIQAQMDLGATLCTRHRPACTRCPLAQECIACLQGRTGELPSPKPKRPIPHRNVSVAVIRDGERVLLERRHPDGIWGGLLSLPEIPQHCRDAHAWLGARFGATACRITRLAPLRHALTHLRLDIAPLHFELAPQPQLRADAHHDWFALARLDHAGLPAPVRRILGAISAKRPISNRDPAA